MTTKFDTEKFFGVNNFGLWRIKMETILIQQGCVDAIKGEVNISTSMSQKEKNDMITKARNTIIICLGDKALREVDKKKIDELIWVKLESLYMTISLAHILCLKQQLYLLWMTQWWSS